MAFHSLPTLFFLLFFSSLSSVSPSPDQGGRYSFSLSTFSPDGRLHQVDNAVRASHNGPPAVACLTYDGKKMCLTVATPVVRPNPFCLPAHRFVLPCFHDDDYDRETDRILFMTFTGLKTDASHLLSDLSEGVIQHQYLHGNSPSLRYLLRYLSVRMQKYTSRPGVRPFGCCMVLGCVECGGLAVYAVYPSGAVESVAFLNRNDKGKGGNTEVVALALGGGDTSDDGHDIRRTLREDVEKQVRIFFREQKRNQEEKSVVNNGQTVEDVIANVLHEQWGKTRVLQHGGRMRANEGAMNEKTEDINIQRNSGDYVCAKIDVRCGEKDTRRIKFL